MQSKPPLIAPHRLARFETLARLWLVRFGAYLIAAFGIFPPLTRAVERECRRLLDRHAHFIRCIVFLRANALLEKAPAPHSSRRYALPTNVTQRAHIHYHLRAGFGSKLRKAMRRGRIGERIAAMNAILADMNNVAAELAHRLRRGLCRLRPIRPRPYGAPASRRPAPVFAGEDAGAPHLAPNTS